jgi:hypothetical protein
MQSSSKIVLIKTLELAGISDSKSFEPKIISEGNTKETIKEVHNRTNLMIKDRLDKHSLGECIHITGEMRALTDPFHRFMCEQISRKSEKDIFKVVYNLPEEKKDDITKIVKWNLENWTSKIQKRNWVEELRTLHAIANRSVNLYTLNTVDKIQYSVFGNKYILLQEKHKDKAETKHTWLLESEALNAELVIKANEIINSAENIDEGYYGRFTQNIGGVPAKRILNLLQDNEILEVDKLINDEIVKDFTDYATDIIESLKIINFINEKNPGYVEITNSGREFIL